MNRVLHALLTAAVALALFGGLTVSKTDAARGWCQVDPVIMVDGQMADIFVGSSPTMLLKATGPIEIVITIPAKSTGYVVFTDLGFLHGYDISFQKSNNLAKDSRHTQLTIDVYAPATTSSLPVTVTFAPRSLGSSLTDILFGTSATGSSNQWVSLATR